MNKELVEKVAKAIDTQHSKWHKESLLSFERNGEIVQESELFAQAAISAMQEGLPSVEEIAAIIYANDCGGVEAAAQLIHKRIMESVK